MIFIYNSLKIIEKFVEMKKSKQGFAVFNATATVDNEVAASAELMCGFKELPQKL